MWYASRKILKTRIKFGRIPRQDFKIQETAPTNGKHGMHRHTRPLHVNILNFEKAFT